MSSTGDSSTEFDVLVIGSGFGGSVSAMRLSQKGYRVGVLEQGKRYLSTDFPRSNWNVRRYLWAPRIRCFGFQKITLLKGVMVLHGSGLGGGSLVYANTLMKPEDDIFSDPAWPKGISWVAELSPHYETAKRMIGVSRNPLLDEGEKALRAVAEKMGASRSFHATEVGVYFGKPGERVSDPYFSGKGPDRVGCCFCGGCMVGCRFESKNSLDYNYLYFAEKWGARFFTETRATRITPPGKIGDPYSVETERSTAWFRKRGPVFRAKRIIVSAGVLGTVELLLKNRDSYRTLPDISSRLGETVRTNGESLLGVTSFEAHRNLSRGIAIGATFRPDSVTQVESVRYPSGSDAMRLLGVPLTPDGNWLTRPLKMVGVALRRLPRWIRLWTVRDWAKSTLILLVMQSVDQKMKLRLGKLGLKGESTSNSIPSYLPVAQRAAQLLADEVRGEPQNVFSEVVLRTPATAHILGGCCMGDSVENGVVDSKHEVFGYPGLYVCDGSVVPANLAVNPSLTITAISERFCGFWPALTEINEERTIRFSV